MSSSDLNPPSLAEAINAKGFMGAAGFRIVTIKPGHAEIALARRDDLLQFFGHFHGGIITALTDHAATGWQTSRIDSFGPTAVVPASLRHPYTIAA